MRLLRHCTSGAFQGAEARCRDFLLAMASPSKKACRRQSASEPRWLARVDAGSASKAGLILPASYLSMRQQSPPTWCALTVGARAESAWWRTRPWGHWETVTFIAGLRQAGIVAPMLIKGAMNGDAFLAYIEQCLIPTLQRRDIVVVDNVSFHKVAGAEEVIRAAG